MNTSNSEQILDNLSTAVMVFDDQFRLRYLNQAGEVMLAHSARHACGRSVHELVTNAGALEEQLAAAITSGNVIVQRGCELELPGTPALRVNCTFTPVFEANGETTVQVELRQVDHQLRVEQDELLINQQQATRILVRGLAHGRARRWLGDAHGEERARMRSLAEIFATAVIAAYYDMNEWERELDDLGT